MYLARELAACPGIVRATVDFLAEQAAITYDPSRVDLFDIEMVINMAGFCLPTEELTLDVRGMVCEQSGEEVVRVLENLPGVVVAAFDVGKSTARVQYVPEVIAFAEMQRAVQPLGVELA